MATIKTILTIGVLVLCIMILILALDVGLNKTERYECKEWIEKGITLSENQKAQCIHQGIIKE